MPRLRSRLEQLDRTANASRRPYILITSEPVEGMPPEERTMTDAEAAAEVERLTAKGFDVRHIRILRVNTRNP
jgi:hypothetical protein